jgi:hypothetical protein
MQGGLINAAPSIAVRVSACMPTPFVGLAACGSKSPSHPQPSFQGEGAKSRIRIRINNIIYMLNR